MMLLTKSLINRADIEPYLGAGSEGPKFGPIKRNIKCLLAGDEKTVIQRPGGVQVVAKGTMYVRPKDKPVSLSKVTIDGQRYEALEVEPLNGPFRIAGYKVALG